MAIADISPDKHARRLDSWKEIAEYVGRDVRTATRWEPQGLPLHRVAGRKGGSVFAYTTEIDAWMAGHPRGTPGIAEPVPSPNRTLVVRKRRAFAAAVAGTVIVALAGIGIATRGGTTALDVRTLRVAATPTEVSIADASGASRVVHRFGTHAAVLIAGRATRLADLDGDGAAEITTGVSFYQHPTDLSVRKGELLNLSAAGAVRWRFSFDDVLTFPDGEVSGPWAVAEWQERVAGSSSRVAVAGHDYTWWASIVAVLDRDGRRQSAFVNPGWIESLVWLSTDRLAVAGFSNARDEAMAALIDANAADGQAPGTAGTIYACASCPTTAPLFYATFPKSELNVLTGALFNRATIVALGNRIVVTTAEIREPSASAIYDFDRDFRLLRGRYSDTYWDAHRRLELEGKLSHSRETCPERDGPPAIHVWNADRWLKVVPPRPGRALN